MVDAEPDIRLERVTKRFGDMTAVDSLDLEVPRGSFYALLGPSGCGKTTTLRMIGGFEDPTDGRVFLGGDDVTERPPYKRDVNTVFQSYALFPLFIFGATRQGVPPEVNVLATSLLVIVLILMGLNVLLQRRLAARETRSDVVEEPETATLVPARG